MIKLLSRFFIKNHNDTDDPRVRSAYGILCGIVGIFLNILLFVGKLIAGIISGAISVTADAFNNLSDAGSSLITLIGFRLAGQKPDNTHPFGHGRIEYISGLLVSIAVTLMGFELAISSIERIITPKETEYSLLTVIILAVSVAVKLYMASYNRAIGKKIHSDAVKVASVDSLCDSFSTLAVLICTLISHFTSLEVDAYCGLALSVIILIAGIRSAIETLQPLLGQAPDKEFTDKIIRIAKSSPAVLGVHDLIVHDYGPGRRMISLHAEVSDHADLIEAHDAIDNLEKELAHELGCDAVIHMDPIAADDEETKTAKTEAQKRVREIDERITIHDFRMVKGPTHTNVIFDAAVPFDIKESDDEIKEMIRKGILEDTGKIAVVTVDRVHT
ncbi:MAG: cation diffusion facilitator family transporter [Eubacteriales bacterium]